MAPSLTCQMSGLGGWRSWGLVGPPVLRAASPGGCLTAWRPGPQSGHSNQQEAEMPVSGGLCMETNTVSLLLFFCVVFFFSFFGQSSHIPHPYPRGEDIGLPVLPPSWKECQELAVVFNPVRVVSVSEELVRGLPEAGCTLPIHQSGQSEKDRHSQVWTRVWTGGNSRSLAGGNANKHSPFGK